MIELVQAGGWLMIPIILCSIIAAAITVERSWTLRENQIAPRNLLTQVW
ncbi:MAG: MotA/TolQ/ExbB proton channel family protein, partial [Gammaproteobacteria bacterium]|nr:MotA/TolQ/ExbB proton channel family protein [Gammaproteobacteria bacterium]